MKKRLADVRWRVFGILAMMIGVFHVLLADPPSNIGKGCQYVEVRGGEGSVSHSLCCDDPKTNSLIAKICGYCGEAGGEASAWGYDRFPVTDEFGNCSLSGTFQKGDVDIKDPDGTGAQHEVTDLGGGSFTWRVWPPDGGYLNPKAGFQSACR